MLPDIRNINEILEVKRGVCPKCKQHTISKISESKTGSQEFCWYKCWENKGGCDETFSVAKHALEKIE